MGRVRAHGGKGWGSFVMFGKGYSQLEMNFGG